MNKNLDEINYDQSISRRELLAVGLTSIVASTNLNAQTTANTSPVRKGGTLRIGMEGGTFSDSLNPLTYSDSIPIVISLMLWNNLVEFADNGNIKGELFESWEVFSGASEWLFNIRKGVYFTSGKNLDADDAIYSLNLHRGETRSPAKSLFANIKEIKKTSSTQIQISLYQGHADLPYVLSDYHVVVDLMIMVNRMEQVPIFWRNFNPACELLSSVRRETTGSPTEVTLTAWSCSISATKISALLPCKTVL